MKKLVKLDSRIFLNQSIWVQTLTWISLEPAIIMKQVGYFAELSASRAKEKLLLAAYDSLLMGKITIPAMELKMEVCVDEITTHDYIDVKINSGIDAGDLRRQIDTISQQIMWKCRSLICNEILCTNAFKQLEIRRNDDVLSNNDKE